MSKIALVPSYIITNLSAAKILDSGEAFSVHFDTTSPKVNFTKHPHVKEDRYLGTPITEDEWLCHWALTQLTSKRKIMSDAKLLVNFDEVVVNSWALNKTLFSKPQNQHFAGTCNASIGGAGAQNYDVLLKISREGGVQYLQLHDGGALADIVVGFVGVGEDFDLFEATNVGETFAFETGPANVLYKLTESAPIADAFD